MGSIKKGSSIQGRVLIMVRVILTELVIPNYCAKYTIYVISIT